MLTRKQLLARVRHYKRWLPLEEWEVAVSLDNPGDGDDAECDAEPQYLRATLRFALEQIPDDEMDDNVAHELWHVLLEELGTLGLAWAGDDPVKRKIVLDTEDKIVTRLARWTLKRAPRLGRK